MLGKPVPGKSLFKRDISCHVLTVVTLRGHSLPPKSDGREVGPVLSKLSVPFDTVQFCHFLELVKMLSYIL